MGREGGLTDGLEEVGRGSCGGFGRHLFEWMMTGDIELWIGGEDPTTLGHHLLDFEKGRHVVVGVGEEEPVDYLSFWSGSEEIFMLFYGRFWG